MKLRGRSFGYFVGQLNSTDTFLSLAVVGLLVMMIVPLGPALLDFFLASSIAAALAILLMAVYNRHSSDFSVFPTVLLLVTLYRLGLNVASTRLILSNGKNGSAAAGQLIETFGNLITHGNTFVGILVFVILNIINFIVITKGAGRISEVAARFMLDSLPGKQLSIDSDLKSGAIGPEEAQLRRHELDRQADFYGGMDGASKFVKGDAIAGLLITGINILGGLFVGIAQEGMEFGIAVKTYTLLTIGDGLVAQFPALIVSTAAGIVVTKAGSSRRAIGEDFVAQVVSHPSVFFLLAIILSALGFFLSGAAVAFGTLSALALAVGFWARMRRNFDEEQLGPRDSNQKGAAPSFVVHVGLGLAHQLSKDPNLHSDLDRFVGELRIKGANTLPVIQLTDSSEIGLFEYHLHSPEGEVLFRGKFRENEYYLIGNRELADFDESMQMDALLGRPCCWVSSGQRDDLVQRGFVVVSSGELFRWHLFLGYRCLLKRGLNDERNQLGSNTGGAEPGKEGAPKAGDL